MSFPGISKRQMESKYKNPKILDVDLVYPKENDEYSVACTELPTWGKFRNIIRICSIFAKEWAKLPNVYLFFSEPKGKYFRNILRKFSSSHWMTIFSWTFLKWMGKLQICYKNSGYLSWSTVDWKTSWTSLKEIEKITKFSSLTLEDHHFWNFLWNFGFFMTI